MRKNKRKTANKEDKKMYKIICDGYLIAIEKLNMETVKELQVNGFTIVKVAKDV